MHCLQLAFGAAAMCTGISVLIMVRRERSRVLREEEVDPRVVFNCPDLFCPRTRACIILLRGDLARMIRGGVLRLSCFLDGVSSWALDDERFLPLLTRFCFRDEKTVLFGLRFILSFFFLHSPPLGSFIPMETGGVRLDFDMLNTSARNEFFTPSV